MKTLRRPAPPLFLSHRQRTDLTTLFDLPARVTCEVSVQPTQPEGAIRVVQCSAVALLRHFSLHSLMEALPTYLVGQHFSSEGRLYPLAHYVRNHAVREQVSSGLYRALLTSGPYSSTLQALEQALASRPDGRGRFISAGRPHQKGVRLMLQMYSAPAPSDGVLQVWFRPGLAPRFKLTRRNLKQTVVPLADQVLGLTLGSTAQLTAEDGSELCVPLSVYRQHEASLQPGATQRLLNAGRGELRRWLEQAGSWDDSEQSGRYCRIPL